MSRVLHSKILDALTDRKAWEDRQRIWYMMRHTGLPRRSKPFVGAADLHFPLIDGIIDKFKPFYLNTVFGTQQLATFTPLRPMLSEAQAAAEQAFDWLTRNETNFEEELDHTFDAMLVAGRSVMKARWDAAAKTVQYECIDPMFLIVPKSTMNLETASWICHVKHLSVIDYKSEPLYLQDVDLIRRMRGGEERQLDTAGLDQEKATREGLTYSNDDDTIILFEVWERLPQQTEQSSGGWRVHTFSPAAPDMPVRDPFRCPYKWQGKPVLPFVSFVFERKDPGWYSPRGVAERLAPFEAYASKSWNAKADFLEFSSKPLFTSESPLSNQNNFRFRPGDYLPPGTSILQMPQPPLPLDEEMNKTRLISQELIAVPDFGTSEQGAGEVKTATEIQYVQSFASQGIQYRGRIAFRSLAQLFRVSWALRVQYAGQEMAYVTAESRNVLPPEALNDNYLIQPNGSPDQWNRQQQLQRAIARFRMFTGHPNINQEELVKSVIEQDDPRLVKRLFISGQAKAANEAEDEAVEILLLMSGFPAAVMPGENHQLRIRILSGKMQQLQSLGVPVDPMAKQRLQEHLMTHVQMLAKENPNMAKQFISAIRALEEPESRLPGQAGNGLPGAEVGAGPGPSMGAGFGVPAPGQPGGVLGEEGALAV